MIYHLGYSVPALAIRAPVCLFCGVTGWGAADFSVYGGVNMVKMSG